MYPKLITKQKHRFDLKSPLTERQWDKNFLLSRDQISSATSVTCLEYQTSHLVIDFGLLTQKLSILYEIGHI